MYENAFHRELCVQLSMALHLKSAVKDSQLLQAYATLHAIVEAGRPDYQEAYRHIFCTNSCEYNYAVLCTYGKETRESLPYNISHNELKELSELFLQVPFDDFLRFGVPGFVGDVEATLNVLKRYFDENIFLFVQHIIQVKMTPVVMKKTGIQIVDSDSHEDVLNKIYNAYCNLERNGKIRISKEVFFRFYHAVNQYPLDVNEIKSVLRAGAEKNAKAMVESISDLRDKLGLSKEQQIDFFYHYFALDENDPRFIDRYRIYHFTQVKDEKARVKLLGDVMRKCAPMYPLECLCATYLAKRKARGEVRTPTEDLVCPNDITLENGLIFSIFSSAVSTKKDVAVFFPSPFFVRKWMADPVLKKVPVTFIFRNESISKIVNYHYYQGTYAPKPMNNVRFDSYEHWLQQVNEDGDIGFDKALVFSCNWDLSEQDNWYKTIKVKAKMPVEIFSLLSSYEFENALSPFSAELSDSQVTINALALIPQGINNSSRPRRKIFMRCMLSPKEMRGELTDRPVKIYAFTLNTDLKVQALSRMVDKPVEIQQQNLTDLYDGIRKIFNDEMLKRRAVGRSKTTAFSYEFSPDITIWCSKSYPKNNSSRPRLEAYICQPASQHKVQQGYLNRGERIEITCKRVTRIPNGSIAQWLDEEYPFSIMQPRHSAKELKENQEPYALKPAIDIREEIINAYGTLLEGQDIALKTFWYLHPDLEDKLSGDDYRLFTQIIKTEIGHLRFSEVTDELCEGLLIRCFAEENKERLWGRYKVISSAIDQAIKYGYCNENQLQRAIQDHYVRDKLFSQVRSALTKKHFTAEEMIKAYTETVRMIDAGYMEFIGVLIRLLTGLESNIVCALKVKDFVEIIEYSISQLRVTCQLTNDGSEYKGFERLEDYRNFPCMVSLAHYLKKHIESIRQLIPRFAEIQDIPLVTTRTALKKTSSRYRPYQPQKLEQLCKSMIASVGIENHIIQVPSTAGGTKETNLNRYGGDFLRENFRHWSLEVAKLDLDEVQFILGNKPITTFGRYYCDYLNNTSQLMMFVKLQRWDVILRCPPALIGKAYAKKNCSRIEETIYLEGQNPLHLHVELIIRRGCGTINIKLRDKFGSKVFSVPVDLVD